MAKLSWAEISEIRHPSAHEPSEGPLYEWLCVFLEADTMSNDQLIEVPRKQLF